MGSPSAISSLLAHPMTQTTEPIQAQVASTAPRVPWRAWWPVTMMLACSLLSYMDRQILAVLSPMILADLKLNAEKYGEIVRAFSFAYMLGIRCGARFWIESVCAKA